MVTAMARHQPTLKETILDAAEEVALREGVARLTFDAVAAEAKVSKGGVLHHFSTKDQLIEAMVNRTADQWRQCYMDAYDRTPVGPGRMARAIVDNCLLGGDSWTEPLRRRFSSVLAALVHDPSLVRAMRETHAEIYGHLQNDGLPPGFSEAIGYASDGLWLSWALRFCDVNDVSLQRLQGALQSLLDRALAELVESPADRKTKVKTAPALRA